MRKMVLGDGTVRTEQVQAHELRVGDRVLVEMEVVARHSPIRNAPMRQEEVNGVFYDIDHVKARPPRDSLWMLSDQEAWTWGWPMSAPKTLTRIVERRNQ